MRILVLFLLLTCAGCSTQVRNIKKVQYYEPTTANQKYCKQPSKEDTGHGPIKSIQYEVRQQTNYNFNIHNSALGL